MNVIFRDMVKIKVSLHSEQKNVNVSLIKKTRLEDEVLNGKLKLTSLKDEFTLCFAACFEAFWTIDRLIPIVDNRIQ